MLPNLSTLSLKPAPREDDLTIVCELEDDVAAKRNFEDVDDPRRQPNPFVHETNWSLETFAEFRDLTLEIEFRRGEMESLMQRTFKKAQARVDSVPMQRTLNEAQARAVGAGKADTIITRVDFDIWVTHNGMGRRFVRADNSSREVIFTLLWDNAEAPKATVMCEVDGIGVTDIFVGECNRKTFEMTNTLHYVYYTTSSRREELHTVEYGAFTGFGMTGVGKRFNEDEMFGERGTFLNGHLTKGKRVFRDGMVEKGTFELMDLVNPSINKSMKIALKSGTRRNDTKIYPFINQEGDFEAGLLSTGVLSRRRPDDETFEGKVDLVNRFWESDDTIERSLPQDFTLQIRAAYSKYKLRVNTYADYAYVSSKLNLSQTVWSQHQLRAFGKTMDPSSNEFMAIQEYFQRPDPELGNPRALDRKERGRYNGIEVVSLEKISYTDEFDESYKAKVETFKKRLGLRCPTAPNRESVETDKLQKTFGELRDDVNQKYLFHGANCCLEPSKFCNPKSTRDGSSRVLTRFGSKCLLCRAGTNQRNIASIITNMGYSSKQARYGLFGPGWYFADKPGKSDEYTVADNADLRYIIIAKVVLGCAAHVSKSSFLDSETRPPHTWREALSNRIRNRGQPRTVVDLQELERNNFKLKEPFTSVIFDELKEGRYREYMVYQELQAIPAFVVAYRRVNR